ncbi:MAG: hypothetical protein AB7P99_21945 [Vicinamibacterales bacterium]
MSQTRVLAALSSGLTCVRVALVIRLVLISGIGLIPGPMTMGG